VDIKPINLVKGQGLARLFVESDRIVLDLNALSTNIIAIECEEDETK
jgi:hypothetical protein